MNTRGVFLAALFLIWGCSSASPQEEPKDHPVERKIETYKVACQEVRSSIEATGSVQADIEGSAKVISALPGTVERVLVRVGQPVKRGAPLVSIRSPEVSDAFSSYLTALSQVTLTKRLYGLSKELFEIGAVTRNDLVSSEANYEQAKAVLEGSKRKLQIYGVNSAAGFTDQYRIHSPMNGVVFEIQAHIGDRVDTSNPLMVVGDPEKVVVVANIYDTQISRIHPGQEIHFTTDIDPQENFTGVVNYISDVSDADSKTFKTYIRLSGGTKNLKQNTFLKMNILDGKRVYPVVPKTALLYKDGKFSVYVSVGGKFERKEVKTAYDVSDKLIAVDGLKEGDEVVLSAIGMEKT